MTPLGHFAPEVCASFLRKLFDRKDLWERRLDRKVTYRTGEWFTLGSPLYLDLLSEATYFDYLQKVIYFNSVLAQHWPELYVSFLDFFPEPKSTDYLSKTYPSISLPGFHIFPGFETFSQFFGKPHFDHQWKTLPKLPQFPFSEGMMTDHFSFTLVLRAPYLGASILLFEDEKSGGETFEYQVGQCYIHTGQKKHAIAAFKEPVLPGDFRITFQGHGFKAHGKTYLYW